MAITQVQRQTFEERLNRIKVGGENTMGEIHVGPREQVRAKDRNAKKSRRAKTRQIKKVEQKGAGPNSVMLPLALFLGALSVAAGRLTQFQLFAPDGLGQITPPVAELASFGFLLIGGFLALMFMWAFELDGIMRKLALAAGFAAMVVYEPMVVERFPEVYTTMYTEGYVAEQVEKVPGLPKIPGLDQLPLPV